MAAISRKMILKEIFKEIGTAAAEHEEPSRHYIRLLKTERMEER